jgi:hypothetical protein
MTRCSFALVLAACGSTTQPLVTNQGSGSSMPAVTVPDGICWTNEADRTSTFFAGRDASGSIVRWRVTPSTSYPGANDMYFDASGAFLRHGPVPNDPTSYEQVTFRCGPIPTAMVKVPDLCHDNRDVDYSAQFYLGRDAAGDIVGYRSADTRVLFYDVNGNLIGGLDAPAAIKAATYEPLGVLCPYPGGK